MKLNLCNLYYRLCFLLPPMGLEPMRRDTPKDLKSFPLDQLGHSGITKPIIIIKIIKISTYIYKLNIIKTQCDSLSLFYLSIMLLISIFIHGFILASRKSQVHLSWRLVSSCKERKQMRRGRVRQR